PRALRALAMTVEGGLPRTLRALAMTERDCHGHLRRARNDGGRRIATADFVSLAMTTTLVIANEAKQSPRLPYDDIAMPETHFFIAMVVECCYSVNESSFSFEKAKNSCKIKKNLVKMKF
ncbi:MAG: hypothetical protein ACP5TY_12500, partial [Thermodesulforhabdaceae bacterium]